MAQRVWIAGLILLAITVTPVLSTAGEGSWTPTGSMGTPRSLHTAALLPTGKVLIAGGKSGSGPGTVYLDTALLYNPSTGAFAPTGSMGEPRSEAATIVLPNGKVLLAGGQLGFQATAELYNPSTGTFTPTGLLKEPRRFSTPTLLPTGKVLLAGGVSSDTSVLQTAELYDPTTGTFTLTGSMAGPRAYATATLLPTGKVLIVGGDSGTGYLATAELYDPTTGTFTPTGSMAGPRAHGSTATLLPTGKVLLAGGYTGTGYLSTAELYDPSTGTFTPTASMAGPLGYGAAVLLPTGKVLLAGGFTGTGDLASAELYCPESPGTFSATGPLGAALYAHTATLLPTGQVLVVGEASGQPIASAQRYNPTTGTFFATPPPGAVREFHTATLLPTGQILIAGGWDSASATLVATAQLYDPTTGAFSATGSLNTPRYAHTATLLPTGQVLIAGGRSTSTAPLASAELYDPTTGTFSFTAGSLNTARAVHTATLLPTGQVLIAGGQLVTFLASAELYDPTTGTFSATGSLGTARLHPTATLLPTGQVLIAGGESNSGVALASAELYDPTTGTFSATGSLGTAREAHTATLLPTGQVLMAGGWGITGNPLAAAELYDPAMRTFSATGSLGMGRYGHTATMLPTGQVLVAGGNGPSGLLASAELYSMMVCAFCSVSLIGTGSGSVTMNPGGIVCPPDCSGPYDPGTTVTLTATPTSGSSFNGWMGEGCSGLGSCTVSATQARNVRAIFTQIPLFPGLSLYDNFDPAPFLDAEKWPHTLEEVREIRGGRLVSTYRAQSGWPSGNHTEIINPEGVQSFRAEVRLNEFISSPGGESFVGLRAALYNDTAGPRPNQDATGDVRARVGIAGDATGVFVRYEVLKCLDPNCNGWATVIPKVSVKPAALTIPRTLGLAWNGSVVTFTVDSDDYIVDPTTVQLVGNSSPSVNVKTLSTRVQPGGAGGLGYVSGDFANLYVNDVPYDNFTTARLDPAKWNTTDLVREIQGKGLVLTASKGGNVGLFDKSQARFANESGVMAMQADVTVTSFSSTNSAVSARLHGQFYNDGTSTGPLDETGDIIAMTRLISNNGGLLRAQFTASRCSDAACENTVTFFSDTLASGINAGPHTLLLAWDGNVFSYGIETTIRAFDPRISYPVMKTAVSPVKRLRANAAPNANGAYGYITATFDNVLVNTSAAQVPQMASAYRVPNVGGDVVSRGVGLRGAERGTINLDLPVGVTSIRQAFLYWATIGDRGDFTAPTLKLPAGSDNPAAVSVSGTLIGQAGDPLQGAHQSYTYRADVTGLVRQAAPVGYNGAYEVAGFPSNLATGNDTEGASLVVIYERTGDPLRNISINDGLVMLGGNSVGLLGYNYRLTYRTPLDGFLAPSVPSGSSLTLLVADGGTAPSALEAAGLNTTLLGTTPFSGSDGSAWDTRTYDVAAALAPGSIRADAVLSASYESILWVAAVLSVPLPPQPVTVASAGMGIGVVTSTPAGIICGSTCTGNFAPGIQVTLTANPAAGSAFLGWSGASVSCPGSGSCTFTVAGPTTVTAIFGTSHVSGQPVLNVPASQTVNEGSQVSFTVSATDTDGPFPLIFAVSNLPAGATFTPQAGGASAIFDWTPNSAQGGPNPILVFFTVSDGTFTDTNVVQITVRDTFVDTDGDGIPDDADNCRYQYNPDQTNVCVSDPGATAASSISPSGSTTSPVYVTLTVTIAGGPSGTNVVPLSLFNTICDVTDNATGQVLQQGNVPEGPPLNLSVGGDLVPVPPNTLYQSTITFDLKLLYPDLAEGSYAIACQYVNFAHIPLPELDDPPIWMGTVGAQTQTVVIGHYNFSGYLAPATNSKINKGRTLPVKFWLKDSNGAYVTGSSSTLTAQKLDKQAGSPIGDPRPATSKSGSGNKFVYDSVANQYQYNLDTAPLGFGWWRLQTHLDDGTVQTLDIQVQ